MENKIKIAYIFSFIYGYINSLGFIIMNGLFFTFMSGNSVRLGVNIGELNLGTGFRYFSLFLFLIFGAFIGDIIFSYYRKTGMFLLLVLELFLFMTAVVFSLRHNAWVVFIPLGIAMGIQNIVNLLIGNSLIGRSFISGIVFNLGIAFSRILQKKSEWGIIRIYLNTWLLFILGAVLGTIILENSNLCISLILITIVYAYAALMIFRVWKSDKRFLVRMKKNKSKFVV